MSSTSTSPTLNPTELQQPPPISETTRQSYTSHSGHGSIGPVIAVLAVITILGAIAIMIGRLCSGRRIMGHGQYYDFDGWVESKFSSCLDGRVNPPPPRAAQENRVSSGSGGAVPVVVPMETNEEAKDEEVTSDPHQHNQHARDES